MLIPEGNVNLIPEFSKNIFRKNRVVCFQTTFHSFQSKKLVKTNDEKRFKKMRLLRCYSTACDLAFI